MKLKLSLLTIIICAAIGGSVLAATPKSITYKGLTLTPAIKNVEVSPDQPTSTFKIKLENKQNVTAVLTPSSLDFKSLNESGGVAFIGNNAASLEHKYGLANWIVLPAGPLTLKPNSSQEVTVTIDNRADLSPGGHYAAVLFKNNSKDGGTGNRVNFNQVVATLVFVKKTGGEIYGLQLQNLHQGTSWFSLPTSLPLTIKNTGNTQTYPRGIVSIERGGKQYVRGQINTDSAMVLPDSSRFYRTPLFSTGHAWLPGYYNLSITYRPEDSLVAKTAEYRFFYVNISSLIIIVVLAALIVTLIRYIRSRKK